MTSKEIKGTDSFRPPTADSGDPIGQWFWLREIAYQFALQNELQREVLDSQRRIIEIAERREKRDSLADPEPGKRDAAGERGGCPICAGLPLHLGGSYSACSSCGRKIGFAGGPSAPVKPVTLFAVGLADRQGMPTFMLSLKLLDGGRAHVPYELLITLWNEYQARLSRAATVGL